METFEKVVHYLPLSKFQSWLKCSLQKNYRATWETDGSLPRGSNPNAKCQAQITPPHDILFFCSFDTHRKGTGACSGCCVCRNVFCAVLLRCAPSFEMPSTVISYYALFSAFLSQKKHIKVLPG